MKHTPLEPLMRQAPPRKIDIVRGLYYGNSPLKFFNQQPEQESKNNKQLSAESLIYSQSKIKGL